ncbi:protein phosphatase [Roseovarius sp. CAU 1744]|uniref:protein-tyrosine phosphatase family protein n=1 Tax=Roseovarius sp. CAU 1744 TaxID=3140368 RepID=UPI00325C0F05
MSTFVIYALPLSDGIVALSPLPGRAGDYKSDLQHLRDWKPAIVISMTTRAEMVAKGADDLGNDLQNMGTRWMHLPIEDFGAPTPEIEEAWHSAARAALAAVQGGGRVLFHCNGGCGRSGMAVLRLMVESGEAPDAALARLRAVRPCAVETEAQMRWAVSG